jgi:hypothetical protein
MFGSIHQMNIAHRLQIGQASSRITCPAIAIPSHLHAGANRIHPGRRSRDFRSWAKARSAQLREEMKRASQEIAKDPARMREAEREGFAPQVKNFVRQAEKELGGKRIGASRRMTGLNGRIGCLYRSRENGKCVLRCWRLSLIADGFNQRTAIAPNHVSSCKLGTRSVGQCWIKSPLTA